MKDQLTYNDIKETNCFFGVLETPLSEETPEECFNYFVENKSINAIYDEKNKKYLEKNFVERTSLFEALRFVQLENNSKSSFLTQNTINDSFYCQESIVPSCWLKLYNIELLSGSYNINSIEYSLCKFSIKDYFVFDVKYIDYCILDNAERIDSLVYRSSILYDMDNTFAIYAYIPYNVDPSKLNLYVKKIFYESGALGGRIVDKAARPIETADIVTIDKISSILKKSKKDKKNFVASTQKRELDNDTFCKLYNLYPVEDVKLFFSPKVAEKLGYTRDPFTSFPEQSIFFYVHKFFSSAISRYMVNHKYEADIFIPELNIAIEYDGSIWHSSRFDSDVAKNNYFSQQGIYLIRIRDITLPKMPEFFGTVIEHNERAGGYDDMIIYLSKVFDILLRHTTNSEIKSSIKSFMFTQKQLQNDAYLISAGSYKK